MLTLDQTRVKINICKALVEQIQQKLNIILDSNSIQIFSRVLFQILNVLIKIRHGFLLKLAVLIFWAQPIPMGLCLVKEKI